jgi:hypothetical protein
MDAALTLIGYTAQFVQKLCDDGFKYRATIALLLNFDIWLEIPYEYQVYLTHTHAQ